MGPQGLGALDAVLGAVARRRGLESTLREVLEGKGYAEVAVPLLQPSESGADWGTAYRVLDQDGTVLDLRPDITGPVARLCAKGDVGGPRPRRLYYQATIFRRVSGEGPREIVQAGAERIGGVAGPGERVTADAEILTLAAECLRKAGAERFLLVLGNAAYVQERLRAAGADLEAPMDALRARDYVGLAEAVGGRGSAAAIDLGWRGDIASALAGGIRGEGPAATEWRRLLTALASLGLAESVLVEPGLLLPGSYYTGSVFEVLVPGAPWPIGDGGRYDRLLGRWGEPEPAVGFALDCDRLLRASDGEAPAEGARRAWAAVRAPAPGGGGRP